LQVSNGPGPVLSALGQDGKNAALAADFRLHSSAVRELWRVGKAVVEESNCFVSKLPSLRFFLYGPEDLRGEPAMVHHVGRS
jgi:hypothetical protein